MGSLRFLILLMYTCFAREVPRSLKVDIPGQGTIMGKEISMVRTQRILGFLGIPFAKPPLDSLRFAAPVTDALPSWDDVRNATEYQPACLQGNSDYNRLDTPFFNFISEFNPQEEQNEDCLYLNVFVPYPGGIVPPEGFAAIVWIHPGNFTTGSPQMWNPFIMVYRQRIIVVTFAYRLNVMGFYTSNDGGAPGNYGIMDQQAALMWVKKNIMLFGGDPNNISLMGYGSGAVSIGLHMVNPQSRGLFSKAIIMSGNFLNPAAVKYPHEDEGLKAILIANFGCYSKTSQMMQCLRRAPADDLVSITSYIDWRPLIDQGITNGTPFLPEPPKKVFDRDEHYKVPILTGYTDMEEVWALDSLNSENIPDDQIIQQVPDILTELANKDIQVANNSEYSCVYNLDLIKDSVLFFYGPSKPIKSAEEARKLVTDFTTEKNYGASTYLHATYISKSQTTYMYRFDMKPSTTHIVESMPAWYSVPHLFDLIYVWGIPFWDPVPEKGWDNRDKQIAEIIMSFWADFAKTSNPTESRRYAIRWDPFTSEEPAILIIDRNFSMSDTSQFNYKSLEFWNDYYPKVVSVATQCCNATDSSSSLYDSGSYHAFLVASLLNLVVINFPR